MSKHAQLPSPNGSSGMDHKHFRGMLPEYSMVCLESKPDRHEWQPLEDHLAMCVACRDELDDLLQMLDETYTGTLAEDSEIPEIDFSYLPPWLSTERVGEPIAVVRHKIDLTGQVLIAFTPFLIAAMHQPHVAGGFRTGSAEQPGGPVAPEPGAGSTDPQLPSEFSYQVHCTPPDDLDIAIDFTLTDTSRALYRVRVIVVDAGDPFAQKTYHVTLSYEAQRIEKETDPRGCVMFSNVPYAALSQLHLTINL